MMQLNIFEGLPDGFQKYHTDNPQIYTAFKKFTFKAIQSGHNNFSAEFIFNIIRWETRIEGNDGFKINNDYKPFYSRLFMNENTACKGFFRTRKSKADKMMAA